ncbi:hypothetical protein V2H45_22930 [Tumidithrix elongata RA019]|uniref:Uncharacterized protein n=1 Tax=Tumidithrix elongata BACA0141 TaxID=2716417 RepID=A0AAW9PX22_9CYAN|nr:hypothetical protein [Tumidithrix elongata RA019]
MERQSFYESFKTLGWQQQLGNIASTLSNISRYAISPTYDELTKLSLREAALAIDWCAPNVPQELLIDLAAMHRELLAWWQVFPVEPRSLLVLHTRHQSDRILIMAGLMIGVDEKHAQQANHQLNGVNNVTTQESIVCA